MIDAATLRLRVLVIDDHMLFPDVIRSALEGVGMEALGPAGTGHDGVTSARRDRPDQREST
jgi:DNA-binding NarL/FixJ family response regulator